MLSQICLYVAIISLLLVFINVENTKLWVDECCFNILWKKKPLIPPQVQIATSNNFLVVYIFLISTTLLNCFLSYKFWFTLMSANVYWNLGAMLIHEKSIQLFFFWFQNFEISFAIDGFSLVLINLTNLIMVLCYWFTQVTIKYKKNQFFIHLILIHMFLSLTFIVKDIVFFYIFFESVLIPMFILIGFWGSRERRIKASFYFFLYTLVGSLFMLFGIFYLILSFQSTNYCIFEYFQLPKFAQIKFWICFFLPFAIKTPVLPFHIWLPEAHVEAPTVGSVILAGLLLKLGGYGFVRFTLPLFNYGNIYFMPCIYILSILSIIYGSLITIRQFDLKRIVAYSSVAHMNLVVLGLFSYTIQGIEGAIYLMVAHGLVSSGLFFVIGMLYEKTHTRLVNYYGGLVTIMPMWTFFFFNFSLANMAFPGTSNFIGELLIMFGLIEKNFIVLIFSGFSIIFSAVYSIWLFNRMCFGTLKTIYFQVSLLGTFMLKKIEVGILVILTCSMWITGVSSQVVITSLLHNFVLRLEILAFVSEISNVNS